MAARFVLVLTNYPASEDPDELRARLAPLVVAGLGADLAVSSGAPAVRAQLSAKGAVFAGDVIGLVTTERSRGGCVVDLTVRGSTTVDGESVVPAKVAFWRLTLMQEESNGRWLVARLDVS